MLAHRKHCALAIALMSFAIDGVGIAFAPTLAIAIALRIFGGLASAVIIPTAFALISEVIPRERHASAMGTAMLGMTVGIALGTVTLRDGDESMIAL